MSSFGREDSRNNMSIIPKMTRRNAVVVIEKIQVKVIDELHYYPSRWRYCSVWAQECGLRLTVGEVSASVLDAFPCHFSSANTATRLFLILFQIFFLLCTVLQALNLPNSCLQSRDPTLSYQPEDFMRQSSQKNTRPNIEERGAGSRAA